MRYLRFFAVLVTCAVLLPAPAAQAAARCFANTPGIGDCIDGRIRTFWEQQGGLPVFGYPIGPQHAESGAAGTFQVQLFERARLELHPENAPPYDVLLGRLGGDALGNAVVTPETPRAGCRFFAQTTLNVCAPFLQTWQRYGLDLGQPGVSEAESLALLGLPLSAPQPFTTPDGQQITAQWFERARLEDHGSQGVLLGLLGREAASASSSAVAPVQTTPASAPAIAPPAPGGGGFVRVDGGRLVLNGQAVLLKGANYYPQTRPWAEMWTKWDGPQMEREFTQARNDLGMNTVRLLIPYSTMGDGTIERGLLRHLQESVQIAGRLNMRVIVALFDFDQDFPAAQTQLAAEQQVYVRSLVNTFKDDDRIIAWNLHNEPDMYDTWRGGGAAQVLDWLGRTADLIHQIDPNHLVTVAPASYDALWADGPDGRRMIDYSDVIGWHNYNANDAARQFAAIREHTGKPVVLEEFGWPTGPTCYARLYTEAEQARVYSTMIGAVGSQVAGLVAWSLRDWDSGPTARWDTEGDYYGLYRPDGSLKPAADAVRVVAAAPLPSAATSDLPLSSDDPTPYGGTYGALLVPGSNHYIKREFRRAWRLFGDMDSFGLPLTEAFVRPSDGRVVQYFERAVLEYHPENAAPPDVQLTEDDRIQKVIWAVPIGITALSAKGVAPAGGDLDGPFRSWFNKYQGSWRLGNPISPVMSEDVNGTPTSVQYFQRGRLEQNPQTGAVTAGLLGKQMLDQLCQSLP